MIQSNCSSIHHQTDRISAVGRDIGILGRANSLEAIGLLGLSRVTLAGLDNGRLLAVLDGTAGGTGGLDALDVLEGLVVGNLAEDDVASVQPRGHNGGDEELGAVADLDLLAPVHKLGVHPEGLTYVLGPALAMDSRPGRVCLIWKFSSANFSP